MSTRPFVHRAPQTFMSDVKVLGSKFQIDGVPVTASAADINAVSGVASDRFGKIARVALAAVDTGGGIFSWVNPEAAAIIVTRAVIDVTTKSTGACTIAVGSTATSAATSSANLLDGLDVGAAAGTFDNLGDGGTNGKAKQKVAVGKWVTGSKASGASAGIVGFAYISYFVV